MELTRQAIKHIRINRFLSFPPEEFKGDKEIIDKNLEFNTCLAALLHDIGHCPFSHLGEKQMEEIDKNGKTQKEKYRKELIQTIKEKAAIVDKDGHFLNIDPDIGNLINSINGSVHEILSCIIILRFYYIHINKKFRAIVNKRTENPIKPDFFFIIRCVLGIPYKDTQKIDFAIRNIMIGLINSKVLDIDKLDYIMRDAFFTGISVPDIDTKRLFKNMYISTHFELVYTSKAIPVIQTIIDSRDNLYLWVYNHHTVVYTDFLYHYIFRRLDHNAKRCNGCPYLRKANCLYFKIGKMKRKQLFSKSAIMRKYVSDSTLQNKLTITRNQLQSATKGLNPDCDFANQRLYTLLYQLFRREFLKPWWKTIFEYKNFMSSRILDDKIRKAIAKRICSDTDGIFADEFRSQIAKAVIALSKKFAIEGTKLAVYLKDGDFFIVERSNRFFTLKSIEEIFVYFKKNEIINSRISLYEDAKQEDDYYGKSFSNLFPKKRYEEFFSTNSFYLYIREYSRIKSINQFKNYKSNENIIKNEERDFYEKIESIFIAVASCLADMNETEFSEYCKEFDSYKEVNLLPQKLIKIYNSLNRHFPNLSENEKETIQETKMEMHEENQKVENEIKLASEVNSQLKMNSLDKRQETVKKILKIFEFIEIYSYPQKEFEIIDDYFDTADNYLEKNKFTLRKRTKMDVEINEARYYITIKSPYLLNPTIGLARNEYEKEYNNELEIDIIINSQENLSELINRVFTIKSDSVLMIPSSLEKKLSIKNERTSIPFTTKICGYTLCLDRYYFYSSLSGPFSENYFEIEIEKQKGLLNKDIKMEKLHEALKVIFNYEDIKKSKYKTASEWLKNPEDRMDQVVTIMFDIKKYCLKAAIIQKDSIQFLNRIVKNAIKSILGTEELITYLPTGDGMILILDSKFTTKILALCYEIQRNIKKQNQKLPMDEQKIEFKTGINIGDVFKYSDINDNLNFAGPGINYVERITSLCNSWHILTTEAFYEHFRNSTHNILDDFHDIGEYTFKHKKVIKIFNIYNNELGCSESPPHQDGT